MKICDDVNLITVEPKNFQRLNNRTVVMANRSRTYSNCLFIFLFFCQKFDSVRSNWTSTHKTIMGSVRSNTYKKKKEKPFKNSNKFGAVRREKIELTRLASVRFSETLRIKSKSNRKCGERSAEWISDELFDSAEPKSNYEPLLALKSIEFNGSSKFESFTV